MGKTTGIAWTDHTFNIAWGCTKVSAGCANCYAESLSERYGHDVWGPHAPRRVFGEKHWREPLAWNLEAAAAGVRRRVFCSSMCDVFEDHPTIDQEREKLWPLIEATPFLDWQILTKRAERMRELLPKNWPNIWALVSVEDQPTADERVAHLMRTDARIRGVSYEPALAGVDFPWVWPGCPLTSEEHDAQCDGGLWCESPSLDWIIVGGESGSKDKARVCELSWIRSAVQQCAEAGVPVFVKQLGTKPRDSEAKGLEQIIRKTDYKGADPSEWPADLRIQEFPA